jgi:hypothetical protein
MQYFAMRIHGHKWMNEVIEWQAVKLLAAERMDGANAENCSSAYRANPLPSGACAASAHRPLEKSFRPKQHIDRLIEDGKSGTTRWRVSAVF